MPDEEEDSLHSSLGGLCALPLAGAIGRYSQDGNLFALGAADGSVVVADARLVREHGVLETGTYKLYQDHSQPVHDVDFHPRSPVLVSASQDCTMRFFDWATNTARASRQCTDTHPVRAVAFHPGGDHLLAATDHHAIHLYDASTFRCYLSSQPADHHTAPVVDARWARDGSVYGSCAGDTIKIWDGVANRCVRTLAGAHLGTAVSMICFGGGDKMLLSCGGDSKVRLWDVGTGKLIRCFEGAQQTSRTSCCFSYNEELVMSSDEKTGEIVTWDTATGCVRRRYAAHSKPIQWLARSPTDSMFMTCGGDGMVRLWASPAML
mmetsp:Transcript_18078/g.54503  ORF Transcript_18078/g.54503 Transcript_18078/m.54503 type:complete len:321 (+) Transcript_18078:35-997(+)